MRGQHRPVSTWLISGPPASEVYLDAHIWQEFIRWVEPASDTDVQRLENLAEKTWRVYVFRDQLNRYSVRDRRRDNALGNIGIEVINARGRGQVNDQDELFIREAMQVYFAAEDTTLARRNAEFLLLTRRHSVDTQITLLTQHRSFRRVPNVNTFYLDNNPLEGNDDLPADFDFLSDFSIHPAIADAIISRIDSTDYGHMVVDAMIGLRDHVRQQSGLSADGRPLMEQAFGSTSPPIALNPLTDPNTRSSQQNEQKGFKEIACGVMTGLRNPLTHEGAGSPIRDRYPDRITLFKYLSLLSLLCERSDGPIP